MIKNMGMVNNRENERLKSRIKNLEAEIKNFTTTKSLSKDESIFKKILEHSTNAFYSHTPEHELTYFSTQVYNILGYTSDEVMIKWTELASDNPLNDEGFRKTNIAIETGKAQLPYELELIHKSGRKVHVEVHEAPVVENGKTVAIVGALTDITNQKIAGTGLKESEEKFKLLFEKSHDPILIIDGYNFVECNEATVKILGYISENEIYEVHPSKLSPKYQPDGQRSDIKAKEMMDIAYNKGYNSFEWTHEDRKGKKIYIDVALTKIPYKGKDMIFTVWRDISKRKKYEQEIIKSEKKYSILFEQAADGILVGIKGGEIVEANESILKLTGYKKNELVGKNVRILFEKEELENHPLRYDLVKKGDTVIRERNIVRKDGTTVPFEMNTKILDDGRMQSLYRDISKRKEAEKEAETNRELLQKAEIVAGLGRYYYDTKSDKWESSEVLNNIFGIDKEYKKDFSNWLKIIHPDFQQEMQEYFAKNILTDHEHFDKVYKIVRKNDKKSRWVHGYGDIEFDSNNQPIKIFGTIQDITKKYEAEITIRESEEKYRSLVENINEFVFVIDKDFKIVSLNISAQRILGAGSDFVGKAIFDVFPKSISENYKISLKQVFDKKKSINKDSTMQLNGRDFYINTSLSPLKNDKGEITGVIGLTRDITVRKLAELALIESEEKYRSIFLNSPLGIIHYNSDGVITDCNSHFVRIIGSSKEALIGLNMTKDLKDENLKNAIKESLIKGESNFEDWYISLTASKKTFVRILFKSIKDEDNKTIAGIGLVEDITERKKAELALEERTNFLDSIIESSALSMWISDSKGTAIRANSACLDFFGAEKEEVVGKYNLFKDEVIEKAGCMPEIRNVFKKGKIANIIIDYDMANVDHIEVKDATHKIVNSIFTPVINSNGDVSNVIVQAIDLTKIKTAEQEIIKSEEKFRLLFENSNDAILVFDNDVFIDCNEKTLKMFKCTRNQIIGSSPNLISPEFQPDGRSSKEKVFEIQEKVMAGKPKIFEWVNKKFDGTEFYAEVSLNKLEYHKRVAIQAIVRDITERKEIEQQIFNAVTEAEEKERQRLASDIHDEIGPLLSGMKMYIESMNENNKVQKQKYLKGQLQSLIKESIENVREVSNALSPYLLRKYGLKLAIKSFLENSKELIKTSFRTNLNEERFPINIETVYFRIIKELFNNTIKHAKAEKVSISLNLKEEKLILIYKDDGIGIKKEDFKRLEKKGIGLFNITNRILSIQGNYNYFTEQKKGFKFQMIKEIKTVKN
jgi:PAS domain S-box-containing protein